MIGWTEPTGPNANKPLNWLKSLKHDQYIYPKDSFKEYKPPSCIFVPEPVLMSKMIDSVARHYEDIKILYSKFGYLQQPKPQWLIEQQELKLLQIKEELRIKGKLSIVENTDSDADLNENETDSIATDKEEEEERPSNVNVTVAGINLKFDF